MQDSLCNCIMRFRIGKVIKYCSFIIFLLYVLHIVWISFYKPYFSNNKTQKKANVNLSYVDLPNINRTVQWNKEISVRLPCCPETHTTPTQIVNAIIVDNMHRSIGRPGRKKHKCTLFQCTQALRDRLAISEDNLRRLLVGISYM